MENIICTHRAFSLVLGTDGDDDNAGDNDDDKLLLLY